MYRRRRPYVRVSMVETSCFESCPSDVKATITFIRLPYGLCVFFPRPYSQNVCYAWTGRPNYVRIRTSNNNNDGGGGGEKH